MPNTLSMYARDLAIRSIFTPAEVTPLTSLEVALTRSVPPNNAELSQIVEPSDPLYERQPYGLDSTFWAPNGFGGLYSTQAVTWAMVLENSWGLISGWVLIEPTAGMIVNSGSILRPYEAITGNTPTLPPGTMVVGFSDAS